MWEQSPTLKRKASSDIVLVEMILITDNNLSSFLYSFNLLSYFILLALGCFSSALKISYLQTLNYKFSNPFRRTFILCLNHF